LKEFHKNNYGIGATTIVIVGDIDYELPKALVKQHFINAPKSKNLNIIKTHLKAYEKVLNTELQVVHLNDKTSMDIIIATPIHIDREHSDFIPLYVGSFILGGNFSARLMQIVRDKEGLTYGIRSDFDNIDFGLNGNFYIWGTFAPKLLDKGISTTENELKKWYTIGVSNEELSCKKETITGAYKVKLATTSGLASTILFNCERGKSLTYIDEYPHLIEQLNLEQVNGVIKKYLQIDNFAKVAAGTIK